MANRIKKGDQVVVTTGKDKGKQGEVVRVDGDRVVVSNINLVKRHTKPNPQAGIAGGLSRSSDKLTDFYLDLARQAGPIVEVGAAKDVVVVIQEGVSLEIKPTAGSKF